MTRLIPDPEPDPRLAGELRRLERNPSVADEQNLIRRIMTAANPVLGQLRNPPRPWWEWMAGWAQMAIPAGVALSLAAGGVLLTERGSINAAWNEDSMTVSETVLSAVTLPAGEARVSEQLLAAPSDELLLNGAYQRETMASPEAR